MSSTEHDCSKIGCKYYYAYIRFKKKWIKIGLFHPSCKTFIQFDDIQMSENNTPENTLYKSEDNFFKFSPKNEFNFSKLH